MSEGEAPESVRRRYDALIARARDQAGLPEAKVCLDIAAKMREQWGDDLRDIDERGLEEIMMQIRVAGEDVNCELAFRLADWMGVELKGFVDGRKRNFWAVVGPAAVVPGYVELYEWHQRQMSKGIEKAKVSYAAGYIYGSAPVSLRPSEDDSDDAVPDYDVDIASVGVNDARKPRARKALTS